MKAIRALVVVLAVAACSDQSPTAVSSPQAPAADPSLIGSLLKPTGLLSCSPLPYDSVTQTIGPLGGSLRVGSHSLVIPPGALLQPTAITAVQPTGLRTNVVRFQPDGLQFQAPAALTMSYANCSLLGVLLPKRIVHVSSALQILGYLLSVDNLLTKRVTGKLNHFSDYAIAW
ncbi:MAG TPA: hypothetical protein VGQ06_08415 [Gemmatimonadales bacterium]|jgi:hypothetical protein|nr:hypothetical protein [Gemmatimonadales bacterium]